MCRVTSEAGLRKARQQLRRGGVTLIIMAVSVSASIAPIAVGQPAVIESFPCVDGQVFTAAEIDGTIYLGGSFNVIGRPTGGWAKVDLADGAVSTATPAVEGTVHAMAPDGTGGWFIGGAFTVVGGVVRANLARIRANGTLDTLWSPEANDTVWTLTTSPDQETLYVGGAFTEVDGLVRNHIAALDADTGELTNWNPAADWLVYALTVASDGTVYVGGYFDNIGGQARRRIAALDGSTGSATAWDPVGPMGNEYVRALALSDDESILYIGGRIQMVGGQVRQRIAALRTSDAGVTEWNPVTGGNDPVIYSIAVDGDSVYAGGAFTQIGGEARNNIACLNASTGAATPWAPNCDSTVYSVAVSDGTVYTAGSFFEVGGQKRWHLAGIDAATGVPTSLTATPDNDSRAIVVSGGHLCVGGNFSILGHTRNNLAAVNATSGLVTDWNPDADGWVTAVEPSSDGSKLYVGGFFGQVGGLTRYNLAAVDADTGTVTAWDPGISGGGGFGFTPPVYALAVDDNTVYVGGDFTDVGSDTRINLAAIDAATGVATSWAPNPDMAVRDLEIEGGLLYVAGYFGNIAATARSWTAAFCVDDGTLTDWNPAPDDSVVALAANSGRVYLAGAFLNVGEQPRSRLAAVDAVTGEVVDWPAATFGAMEALVAGGGAVYTGGNFSNMGETAINHLAMVGTTTGQACTSWDAGLDDQVGWLVLLPDRLIASGYFQVVNGQFRPSLAAFELRQAPAASDGSFTVTAGESHSETLPGTGGSGTLEFVIVDQGNKGTVTLTNAQTGAYTYAANSGESGNDSFTYRVSDACLNSEVGSVTVTVTAAPEEPPPVEPTLYTLSTLVEPSGAGTITATPQAASYEAGTAVTLTAVASEGYRFVRWQGDAAGLAATTSLTLSAAKYVQALFAPVATSAAAAITTDAPVSVALSDPTGETTVVALKIETASAAGNVVLNANASGEAHGGVTVGFAGGAGLARSVTVHSDLPPGSFTALLQLYYTDEEVAGLDESGLRLFRWNDTEQQWKHAATTDRGVSAPTGQLGDHGVDSSNNRVWAIVDRFSEFGIGLTARADPTSADPVDDEPPPHDPTDEEPGPQAQADDDQVLADPVALPVPCGACGSGVPLTGSIGLIALALLRRTR